MEGKLQEIQQKFQSGQCKQAIHDLETLINDDANDLLIYKAHDLLGDYLNYIGEHARAVQSWEKSLEILETNDGGVDQLDDQQTVNWINISIQTARVLFQQGKDGPGVSHKSRSVSIVPSKMSDNEKEEWINHQWNKSIKYFRQALTKIPEHLSETKLKIQTELAAVLLHTKNFDEALQIYEDGFYNYGKVEWLYRAAHCLWQQGKKDLAYKRLEQLIDTDPKFANAYQMSAGYFEEKDEQEKALEHKQKYEFYSWVPKFCQYIEFNQENSSILTEIRSGKALECVQTTLKNDSSRRSTEFLASLCYHHYHGAVDNTAFEQLEIRGMESNEEEKDFIRSVLMYLIENCGSVCTRAGAANALAAIKHERLLEVLAKLIYQDIDYFHPMNIPFILVKLGDPRAIPILTAIAEERIKYQTNDDDSSDEEIFSSLGISRLIQQSCLALGSFIDDEKAKQVLVNGIEKERTHQPCLAALYVATLECQYLRQIERILEERDTLDHRVTIYLYQHGNKSEDIGRILSLNDEIFKKKQATKNKKNNRKH